MLVTPISPSDRGNGLAMRAGMFLDALAAVAPVHLVVVPAAGRVPLDEWATSRARQVTVIELVSEADAERHVVMQMGDATLRAQLERTAPLPARARTAPATLAASAAEALHALATHSPVVLSMRNYLAPFGITLARKLGASRIVVDLDDDDEALLHAAGHLDEAASAARLARAWLPTVDAVTLASPYEAEHVARRYELTNVDVIANAARRPITKPSSPSGARVLFVGNLTYAPNIDAARTLVLDVLSALRQTHPSATVELVGVCDERIDDLRGVEGVTVVGPVPDVAPWYERAAAVVVPLESGGGTRIKVLEAFAHQRPVVATPAAVAGLDVRPGVDVLLGSTPAELAHATATVLADPIVAQRLTAAALETFAGHYAPDVVAPIIRRVVLGDEC